MKSSHFNFMHSLPFALWHSLGSPKQCCIGLRMSTVVLFLTYGKIFRLSPLNLALFWDGEGMYMYFSYMFTSMCLYRSLILGVNLFLRWGLTEHGPQHFDRTSWSAGSRDSSVFTFPVLELQGHIPTTGFFLKIDIRF